MSDHADQLKHAFETHENLAPDPAAVYARVQQLARTYQRRRRGAQVAGGAVLGAGLIAGAINAPALLPGRTSTAVTVMAPGTATSPSPSPSQAELQKDWDAYFAAGYDYDDALKLAKIWHSRADVGAVKAEAGRRLLAGETLPVRPGPAGLANAKETARVNAFFAAGYDYDDAALLAKLWKTADAYHAKIEGGRRLLAGQSLPVKPGSAPHASEPSADPTVSARLNAFFAAGYDYNDAARLARLWTLSDPYQAKIEGGKRLLAGQSLPIKP